VSRAAEAQGLFDLLSSLTAMMTPPATIARASTAGMIELPANLFDFALGLDARTDFATDKDAAGFAGAANAGVAVIESAATATVKLLKRITNSLNSWVGRASTTTVAHRSE
jgi:hypothetical protein